MPKLHPVQDSFKAGELSPLMLGRPASEGYKNGLQELRNMYPDARGPVLSRVGLNYIGRGAGNDGRVEHLQITESEYYLMLFSDLRLEISTTQGLLPGNNLVTNPNFEDGETGWTTRASTGSFVSYAAYDCRINPYVPSDSTLLNPDFTLGGVGWNVRTSGPQSTVSFSGGICTMSPRNVALEFAGISQQATATFTGETYTLRIVKAEGCDQMSLQVGTAEDDGTYLDIIVPSGAGAYEVSVTIAASPYWITLDSISSGNGEEGIIDSIDVIEPKTGHTAGIAQQVTTTQVGLPHLVSIDGDVVQGQSYRLRIGTAEGDGTYYDEQVGVADFSESVTPAAANFWITIDADYPSIDPTLVASNVSINEPNPGGDDFIGWDTVWTEQELKELQLIPAPQEGVVYFVHRNHPVYKLTYTPVTQTWDLVAVTFTSAPAAWTGDTYPQTGTVFEGRFWLGGPKETFWGSKSGVLEDFTTGSQADDALEFTMAKYGDIRWIAGIKNLLIGTENGEHIVTSEGGVITPNDIKVEQQSSYGSALISPVQVGDQIFYVSSDRRKLRAMQYEWTANNWLSVDLTFASEHITEGLIKSITWAQNPDNLLLMTLLSGDVAVLRYERSSNIYGWSLLEFAGDVKDLTSGTYFGNNEVAAITQNIPDNLDLEHFGYGKNYFMDSWIEVYNEVATTTIVGLDHLEGKVVQVLTDGAVHPERLVTNGVIELQWEANHVVTGLGFTSSMKTFPLDIPLADGSSMSKMKHRNKIFLRLLNSTMPLINGQRPADRTPSTPMDDREPNRTQDVSVANLGFDPDVIVEVEQDLPLDLTVLAIFGEARISNL